MNKYLDYLEKTASISSMAKGLGQAAKDYSGVSLASTLKQVKQLTSQASSAAKRSDLLNNTARSLNSTSEGLKTRMRNRASQLGSESIKDTTRANQLSVSTPGLIDKTRKGILGASLAGGVGGAVVASTSNKRSKQGDINS